LLPQADGEDDVFAGGGAAEGAAENDAVEAQVTMRGMLAETQATLTLAVEVNPAQRMEGRLVFPLPPGCVVTGAALDIGDIMRPASVTFKSTAKQAYDSVVSRMLDPCLFQLLPDGRVSVQVFPFAPFASGAIWGADFWRKRRLARGRRPFRLVL